MVTSCCGDPNKVFKEGAEVRKSHDVEGNNICKEAGTKCGAVPVKEDLDPKIEMFL